MVKPSETGHYKNVSNFQEVISNVLGYGPDYKPSKAGLSVLELQALATRARDGLNAVDQIFPGYSAAVAAREVGFIPLGIFTTRILNALRACGVSAQVVDNAKTVVRKIQGTRATPKKSEEEKRTLAAKGVMVKEISSAQTSFDGRLENLNKLVKIIQSIPEYAPNESELQPAAVNSLYNKLFALNAAVVDASAAITRARIARDNILYASNTGLLDVATDVKTYVKSLYGASSPQFKHISKIEFRTIKA